MQITKKLKSNSSHFFVALLVMLSITTISCRNMFAELADKEADAALHYEAKRLLNSRNYTEAIDILEQDMSANYFQRRDVQRTLASAYVGRCGLDFLGLATGIIAAGGTNSPMDVALNHMKAATSEADCLEAENIMRAVSENSDGILSDNNDDAFFMTFISLAKVGAILARIGDAGNDGVIDGGFDACAIADADTREIGSALTLIYNNISATGSDIASHLGSFSTVCSNPAVQAAGTCAKTDPTTFSAGELDMLRGVVNYSPFGVGADVAYTICP